MPGSLRLCLYSSGTVTGLGSVCELTCYLCWHVPTSPGRSYENFPQAQMSHLPCKYFSDKKPNILFKLTLPKGEQVLSWLPLLAGHCLAEDPRGNLGSSLGRLCSLPALS